MDRQLIKSFLQRSSSAKGSFYRRNRKKRACWMCMLVQHYTTSKDRECRMTSYFLPVSAHSGKVK